MVGKMYMYFYDPKTKDKLPYYDRFPMIILVGAADKGFYGLNLHYLRPTTRAAFLDSLVEELTRKPLTANSRIRVSYKILSAVNKFSEFRPCYKRYLMDHVASRVAEIPGDEWGTAIFLPTEHFQKTSKHTVWRDSRRQI